MLNMYINLIKKTVYLIYMKVNLITIEGKLFYYSNALKKHTERFFEKIKVLGTLKKCC